MQAKSFNRLSYSIYSGIIITCAIFLLFFIYNCSENVAPEGKISQSNLFVSVMVFNTSSVEYDIPAIGAKVEVYNEQSGELLMSGSTNSEGKLTLTFKNINPYGIHAIVKVAYQNRFYQEQKVFICKDNNINILLDEVIELCCDNLTSNGSLLFDDQGKTYLRQNSGTHYKCKTLFVNCPGSASSEPMFVTIPNVPAPFSIDQILIDGSAIIPKPTQGSQVLVNHRQSLTVCFSVPTNNTGTFNENLVFQQRCESGSTGRYTLNLSAEISQPECDCPTGADTMYVLTMEEKVKVGASGNMDRTVFTNNLGCDFNITSINNISEVKNWTITNPSNFPSSVASGNNFNISARFSPQKRCTPPDTFLVNIRLSTGVDCRLRLILVGTGCEDLCPTIDTKPFNGGRLTHFVPKGSNDNDTTRVEFSPPLLCNAWYYIATREYKIEYPECSCLPDVLNLQVAVRDTESAQVSMQRFEVTPKNLTLRSGANGLLSIKFKSPTIREFEDIFDKYHYRNRTGNVKDSMFTIFVDLIDQTGACRQTLKLQSIVSNPAELSPNMNLRAYSQVTDKVIKPEYETCDIRDIYDKKKKTEILILYDPDTKLAPNPPDSGDIYVEVNNPNNFNPPMQPRLFLVGRGSCFEYVKELGNYQDDQFKDVAFMINELKNKVGASPGTYFTTGILGNLTTPVTNLQIDKVYVLFGSIESSTNVPCCLGLILIREIKTGVENNNNHQSAIEFKVISPVYLE